MSPVQVGVGVGLSVGSLIPGAALVASDGTPLAATDGTILVATLS